MAARTISGVERYYEMTGTGDEWRSSSEPATFPMPPTRRTGPLASSRSTITISRSQQLQGS